MFKCFPFHPWEKWGELYTWNGEMSTNSSVHVAFSEKRQNRICSACGKIEIRTVFKG